MSSEDLFLKRYVKNAEPTEICGIFVCLHAINVACVAMGPILHLLMLFFGLVFFLNKYKSNYSPINIVLELILLDYVLPFLAWRDGMESTVGVPVWLYHRRKNHMKKFLEISKII